MELGYYARRTLIPTLMEWVEQSRLRKSLPTHECEFFSTLAVASIQVNLTNLDKAYIQKHIEPNMQSYCDSFVKQIEPVLKNWCIKCNLQHAKIQFRFKAHFIYGTEVNIQVPFEELKQNRL